MIPAATAPAASPADSNLSVQHTRTDQDVWNEWKEFVARKKAAVSIRPEWNAPNSSTSKIMEWAFETQNPTVQMINRYAESQFDSLFRLAQEVPFEDGIENEFSKNLSNLVQLYGPFSKDILAGLFEDNSISPEVISESLRWLGRMEDQSTREARLWLLEHALSFSNPSVRDGAILGLASMDDPSAVRYLERAIQRETIPELREDMEQVLEQLQK